MSKRLERAFGPGLVAAGDRVQRLKQAMTPEMRVAIRTLLEQHAREVADLRDQLDDQDELTNRLTFVQCALIALLEQQGGSVTLYAGQLGEIPRGSVIKIDKLAPGEGDRVPLRVSWRPPDPDRPATTDYRPGG